MTGGYVRSASISTLTHMRRIHMCMRPHTHRLQEARAGKRGSREAEAGLLALEGLHRSLMPFVLRRTKGQVLQDLPPKIITDVYCDMAPFQACLYEQFQQSQVSRASCERWFGQALHACQLRFLAVPGLCTLHACMHACVACSLGPRQSSIVAMFLSHLSIEGGLTRFASVVLSFCARVRLPAHMRILSAKSCWGLQGLGISQRVCISQHVCIRFPASCRPAMRWCRHCKVLPRRAPRAAVHRMYFSLCTTCANSAAILHWYLIGRCAMHFRMHLQFGAIKRAVSINAYTLAWQECRICVHVNLYMPACS